VFPIALRSVAMTPLVRIHATGVESPSGNYGHERPVLFDEVVIPTTLESDINILSAIRFVAAILRMLG